MSEPAKLHPALPIAPHLLHYRLIHPPDRPRLWKNRLPRNQSLVPKRLGTADKELETKDNIGIITGVFCLFFTRSVSSTFWLFFSPDICTLFPSSLLSLC